MTDQIQPALTPKEWQEQRADVALGLVHASLASDLRYQTGDLEATGAAAPWLLLEWNYAGDELAISDRHKIAALALHQQPYGFAHDDPYILREIAATMDKLFDSTKMVAVEHLLSAMGHRVRVRYYAEELEGLAARIEALLPPDIVEEPTYEGEDGG